VQVVKPEILIQEQQTEEVVLELLGQVTLQVQAVKGL
jgi:hypothetical protein